MGERMRGRKPKPTRLKVLNGNPGKRALPNDEPVPTGEVVKPAWLRPSAGILWDQYAPELIELGLITSIDVEKFGQWCTLAAMFRRQPHKMPANLIARMDSMSERFGMDPSARARMGTPSPRNKQASNPFKQLGS